MSSRRITAAAVTTAAIALALTGCAGSPDPGSTTPAADCTPAHADLTPITPGTLTVTAYVSPPYTTEEDGTIKGVDGEIVAALAKLECLQLDAQAVAGAALPSTVESGRSDIAIGGVYANADRAATFSLTVPMYLDQAALLSRDGIDSIEGLQGKKLGVIQGYLWNAEFQTALGSDNVVVYQDSASLVADIQNGRVDAGAFTSAEAALRAQESGSLKSAVLQPTPEVPSSQQPNDVVLLLNKSATALTDALNDDIKSLIDDGTMADILQENGIDPSLVAKD